MVLVIDHVSHHFASESGELRALRDVSLRVQPGEFVALVGPSGCGKTTLLRVVGGLLRPEHGRVLLGGEPLNGPPPGVGMVFQRPALLPWRTVRQNIRLPLELTGEAEGKRVARLLAAVGLEGWAEALPAQLSGGMQQRVALARALVGQPRVLLMDEPFAALDMMLRNEMNELLLALWEQERPTVLFVTHDLHEAAVLADRVVVMSPRPGRIVGEFPVPLPRPRHTVARYGPEVQALVAQMWALLEAQRDPAP